MSYKLRPSLILFLVIALVLMLSIIPSGNHLIISDSNQNDFREIFQNDDNAIELMTTTPDTFVSKWNTSKTGSSESNEITLPLEATGTYNFVVDWGDGSNSTVNSGGSKTHTYGPEGVYTVKITGQIEGWRFNNAGDKLKIIEIIQWGDLNLGNSGGYFYGCTNLEISATDSPDLTGTTSLNNAFLYASKITGIGSWDVSGVTDMDRVFEHATSFNQPIGNWNVSNVVSMNRLFFSADTFNQPLNNWDVSNVNDMTETFYGMETFNQPLNNWDVSSVTNMDFMFSGSILFNQPLNNWDVSGVTDMEEIFYQTDSFDQDLGDWNVSSVTDITQYFLEGPRLSASNYDKLLIGWSSLSLQTGMNFGAPTSFYSSAAMNARQSIIDTFTWTFTDAGIDDTPSEIDTPVDISFGEDETGYSIVWTAGDKNPSTYDVLLDGDPYLSEVTWTNGTITIDLDGLDNGIYNFTIIVSDKAKYPTYDTVIVTVDDLFAPTINSPVDMSYEEGTTGHSITWTVADKNPATYDVLLDGIADKSDITWTNGTITLNIDGLSYGDHNYTITISDIFGHTIQDTVLVEVTDSFGPTVDSPSDVTYEEGTTGNTITWTVVDKNPGVYNGTLDGEAYESSISWTNGTIVVNIDGLKVGTYNLTLYIYDEAGNRNTDSVIITVKAVSNPTTVPTDTTSGSETSNLFSPWIVGTMILVIGGIVSIRQLKKKEKFR